MRKLITGLHQFQSKIFKSQQELFEKLAQGQAPEALFITCSDSRINPNLITQTDPGDIFVLRNAGNLIPPFGAANGGEGATIEFALVKLGVKDIIVCGHSFCGAVKGMLHPEILSDVPVVEQWLRHAEATRAIIRENYSDIQDETELMSAAVQENVLVQLENLKTHPSVASRLSRGELFLHGWTYKIETGQVFSYDPNASQFLPVSVAPGGLKSGQRITRLDTI